MTELIRAQTNRERRGGPPDDFDGVWSNQEPAGLAQVSTGSTTPSFKHGRDFLTGSVVDRAVQQAAEAACEAEEAGTKTPGITSDSLLDAIEDQVQAVAESITPANVAEFVDVPDGMRVTNTRRIEPQAIPPRDILR